MTIAEREALLLNLLEKVTPTLRRYAASTSYEFEDLRQDAVVNIMAMLDSGIGHIDNLAAYTHACVRSRIIDKIRHDAIDGLHQPRYTSDSISLEDFIADPYQRDPLTILLIKEQIEELAPLIDRISNTQRARKAREIMATVLAFDDVQLDCAWCLREKCIDPGSGSHGICQAHADQMRAQRKASKAARRLQA